MAVTAVEGDVDFNMPRSRLEVNFLKLFRITRQMASGAKPKDWTYEEKVEWLEKNIPGLERSPCPPSPETLKMYRREVKLLRSVVEADKSCNDPELASSLVSSSNVKATSDQSIAASLSTAPAYDSSGISQQIHHRTTASITNKLRQQLMGSSNEDQNGDSPPIRDIDGIEGKLALDEKRRDHLLSDMLAMTKQWKEQSKTAGTIIKKDIETMDKSSTIADLNHERLKTESDKLSVFNQRACNCWIWFMLFLVCCVFISMVIFMKIFPKRRFDPIPN